ncbi:MAG: hypothetical protein ACKVRN_10115 [Pyrinomonadaceae bacterium]
MIKRILLLTFAAILLSVGAPTVSAQKWENLGSKEVKDRSEQDTWHIGSDEGQFRKLKLTVQNRPVRFYKLVVTYGNGEKQEFQIRNLIRAGGETRALDLDGKDRYIRKVDVWYEAATARRGVRSQVTLYGRK